MPWPGPAGHRRRAAVAAHPPHHRLGDAAPVGRNRAHVEAGALVANVGGDPVGVGLDVDGDPRRPGVTGGIDRRLLAGEQQGLDVLAHRGVADHDGVDRHVVELLDAGGQRVDGPAEVLVVGGGGAVVEPGPQLALLAPGQRRDVGRVVAPLDQGEGVQHRVVEMGGDLGPLLGADALAALLAGVADQAEDPGTEDQAEPGRGHQHHQQGGARRRQGPVGDQEDGHAGCDQQRAAGNAERRDPAPEDARHRVAGQVLADPGPALPVALVTAGPDQRGAGGRQRHRPGQCVAEPHAGSAEEEHAARDDACHRGDLSVAGTLPATCGAGWSRVGPGAEGPEHQVEDDAGAPRRGEHGEPEADQQGVDAQGLGQPAGRPGEDAVAPAAHQEAVAARAGSVGAVGAVRSLPEGRAWPRSSSPCQA